ncbi:MAG: FkbM family methyltransferase [Cytophagales bacterium]|nr:FkbM family methyltransferase [Cytophagales bacterium]
MAQLETNSLRAIDIGANVGFFPLFMFYYYPKATISAYEPMPFCFDHLNEYRATYQEFDFEIFNQAVGQGEVLKLHTTSSENFSTISSVFATEKKGQSIDVKCVTLDSIMTNEQMVDLLKIDCEGSEYEILYNLSDEAFSKIGRMSIETH